VNALVTKASVQCVLKAGLTRSRLLLLQRNSADGREGWIPALDASFQRPLALQSYMITSSQVGRSARQTWESCADVVASETAVITKYSGRGRMITTAVVREQYGRVKCGQRMAFMGGGWTVVVRRSPAAE
jgi:hypothetical protein